MDRKKYEEPADHVPLCPLCEGELCEDQKTRDGWNCACGEYVPKGCHIPPRLENPTGCNALAHIAEKARNKPPED